MTKDHHVLHEEVIHLPQQISPFLYSNEPPSSDEYEIATSFQRDLESRLHETEIEIARLQGLHKYLQSKVNLCTIIRSPTRRLPPEILEEIFSYLIESADPSYPNFCQVPFVLSQVCSSWRAVSINMEPLWQRLVFRAFKEQIIAGSAGRIFKSLYRMWHLRSKSKDLYLSITLEDYLDEEDSNSSLILKALIENITVTENARLRHLYFSSYSPAHILPFFPLTAFTQLETLIVRGKVISEIDTSLSLFQSCLNLRRLCIDANLFQQSVSRFMVPWHQLTHLIITDYIEKSLWMQIFRMCKNLQWGVFHFEEIWRSGSTAFVNNQERFVFPSLQSLTITSDFPVEPHILFRGFDFPALTTLRLGYSVDQNHLMTHISDAHHFEKQVQHLRKLSLIGGYPVEFHKLQSLLALMPLLEELDVHVNTEHDWLLEFLGDASSLPKLEVLSIVYTSTDPWAKPEFPLTSLFRMVCVRSETNLQASSSTRLRRICIYSDDIVDRQEEIRNTFSSFQDSGLIIVLGLASDSHWKDRLSEDSVSWADGMKVFGR